MIDRAQQMMERLRKMTIAVAVTSDAAELIEEQQEQIAKISDVYVASRLAQANAIERAERAEQRVKELESGSAHQILNEVIASQRARLEQRVKELDEERDTLGTSLSEMHDDLLESEARIVHLERVEQAARAAHGTTTGHSGPESSVPICQHPVCVALCLTIPSPQRRSR